SGYVTIVATVLFAPYLTSVAETAACGPGVSDDNPCQQDLHVLGVSISPGSMVFYVVTIATVVSAIALPVVGAAADRSARKPALMARYA
ncbi:MFS transporter, partial [Escherichia coli]